MIVIFSIVQSINFSQFPYTPGPNAVVVQNNAPNIFPNPYQCHNYQNAVGAYVLYNRAECGECVDL